MEVAANGTLLKRLGTPQEIAAAVFYIATQVSGTSRVSVLIREVQGWFQRSIFDL